VQSISGLYGTKRDRYRRNHESQSYRWKQQRRRTFEMTHALVFEARDSHVRDEPTIEKRATRLMYWPTSRYESCRALVESRSSFGHVGLPSDEQTRAIKPRESFPDTSMTMMHCTLECFSVGTRWAVVNYFRVLRRWNCALLNTQSSLIVTLHALNSHCRKKYS